MKEKRNYKQEVKEWWSKNKRVVKTGVICLGVGTIYGFVKGAQVTTNGQFALMNMSTDTDDRNPDDNNLCLKNDPEWLELERLESESQL